MIIFHLFGLLLLTLISFVALSFSGVDDHYSIMIISTSFPLSFIIYIITSTLVSAMNLVIQEFHRQNGV